MGIFVSSSTLILACFIVFVLKWSLARPLLLFPCVLEAWVSGLPGVLPDPAL